MLISLLFDLCLLKLDSALSFYSCFLESVLIPDKASVQRCIAGKENVDLMFDDSLHITHHKESSIESVQLVSDLDS